MRYQPGLKHYNFTLSELSPLCIFKKKEMKIKDNSYDFAMFRLLPSTIKYNGYIYDDYTSNNKYDSIMLDV